MTMGPDGRQEITVAGYLLLRLEEIGVQHLFGVPGDFVLGLLNAVLESRVRYIGTCSELNAAYAADGYARIRGIGAFATTFGVGELSALNGVAGAFAERVPVVAITGSPATENFRTRPLLHHTLGDYQIPLRMFEKITAASAQLSADGSAPAEIDRVLLACLRHQLPVYLSIPSDVVRMPCARPVPFPAAVQPMSDQSALIEAVAEAAAMLTAAQMPVVIGGVELRRYGMQRTFAAFLERSGFPYVTMMLGKTLLSEHHPQFIGLFQGERSRTYVRDRVDAADCIVQLGVVLTDFNTGGFTAHLDENITIRANRHSVRIRHHLYEHVLLEEFIEALTNALFRRDPAVFDIRAAAAHCQHRSTEHFVPESDRPLTVQRLFDRMSHHLRNDSIVVAETGVALFSAAETLMPEGAAFIGQTFYGSIGYTVGAALGAAIAAPERPVVLFVGDGAFQVTCQDLSTMIRNNCSVLILLLNNDGYTIERVIVDRSYNDLQPWKYHALPAVFGGAAGYDVRTEGELDAALTAAGSSGGVVFIEVHTDRMDAPESLRSAGRSMAEINHLL